MTPTEMRDRYQAGEGCIALSRLIGCAPRTVLRRLRRMGVTIRTNRVSNLTPTPQWIETKRRYEAGSSCIALAAEIGCSKSTVLFWLRHMGVTIRSNRVAPAIPWSEVRRRYEAGASCIALAPVVGCSKSTVARTLRRLGVKLRGCGGNGVVTLKWGDIKSRYENGASTGLLAREFRCTKDTIRRALLSMGVTLRGRGGANRVPRHVLDQRTRDVVKLYFEDCLGIKAIALRLGVSAGVVRAAIRRAGLRTRGQTA